jgi:hypothetical protein
MGLLDSEMGEVMMIPEEGEEPMEDGERKKMTRARRTIGGMAQKKDVREQARRASAEKKAPTKAEAMDLTAGQQLRADLGAARLCTALSDVEIVLDSNDRYACHRVRRTVTHAMVFIVFSNCVVCGR